MITGFEEQTNPLNEYERDVLLPVILKGLRTKIGKGNAVTNKHIIQCLSPAYRINDARLRKLINHIRVNGLLPCLMATSEGYYISNSLPELQKYVDSLKGREDAIKAVRVSITRQMNERFNHDNRLPL